MISKKDLKSRIDCYKCFIAHGQDDIHAWQRDLEKAEKELEALTKPKHGDIVVFHCPGSGRDEDKRVILNVQNEWNALDKVGYSATTGHGLISELYQDNAYEVIGNVFDVKE